MLLTDSNSVSLSGNTAMFESARGGRKKKRTKKRKTTVARKSRSSRKQICARCKKKTCNSVLCRFIRKTF